MENRMPRVRGSSASDCDGARAHATPTDVARVVASPSLVRGLLLAPLIGALGIMILTWSHGAREGLFALGALLVMIALVLFRALHGRLVTQVELHFRLSGVRTSQARARAEREVERLLRRLVGRDPPA